MRTPLWQTFGEGYEYAHQAAREWLLKKKQAVGA
jgi:hypothetical protein